MSQRAIVAWGTPRHAPCSPSATIMDEVTPRLSSPRRPLIALMIVAGTSGAAVMLLEILGSRLLTPFFGVGLYVWSALIGVTLASLAMGYFLGALLAERVTRSSLPATLLSTSGALIALVPWLRAPVLLLCDSAGVRLGALASATLLLAPALTAMGMTSTVVVHAAAPMVGAARAAGMSYAISTAAGLAATLATGFWLVPSFSPHAVLLAAAGCVIAVGAVAARALRPSAVRNGPAATVAAASVYFLALAGATRSGEPLPAGLVQLARTQSPYAELSVLEDRSRVEPLRLLRADHSFLGALWTRSETSGFAFTRLLEAAALAREGATRTLQIGLGIGTLGNALRERGMRVDTIELDAKVVALAQEYFGFKPAGDVWVGDARTVIRRLTGPYDVVVHDLFTGGAVPEHMLTVEVFERLGALLRADGLLIVNAVGAPTGPLSLPIAAVGRTLGEAFEHVEVFAEYPALSERRPQNLVLVASAAPFARAGLPAYLEDHRLEFEGAAAAPVVTDARNPLARLSQPVADAFHEAMRTLYPAAVWVR